jgi:hypothetical protein
VAIISAIQAEARMLFMREMVTDRSGRSRAKLMFRRPPPYHGNCGIGKL